MKIQEGQLKLYETRDGKEEAFYFQTGTNEHWVKRYLNHDRYEISGLLAVGGFGCVFGAYDRWNCDNRVVIKTPFYMGDYCRPYIARSQEIFEKQIVALNKQYEWEKKHLCGFSNAGFNNIVNLNDAFQDRSLDLCRPFRDAAGVQYFVNETLRENAPYLVLKYIRGKTLKEIIAKKPLSTRETLRFAKQILALMKYLHKERHTKKGYPFYYMLCDLKAENVIVCDGQTMLLDFGAVKIYRVDQQEVDVPIFVTDGYAAPEVYSGSLEFRDNPQIDKRFDLFTVGALMAQCLTGKHPQEFLVSHIPPQHDFHLQDHLNISQSLENIILKATSKDRNHRYPDADSMIQEIVDLLQQEK